jgi:hypothetical protein
VHWRPGGDTVAALVSYALVVAGLYTAFQVFTTDNVAANFITFGPVTLAGLGVALPILYTVLVRKRPLADLGLTVEGLTFGAFFRLTKNVAVLWPFYTPTGGLYTNLSEGLTMPFEATYGFLLTLGLMAGLTTLAVRLQGRPSRARATDETSLSEGVVI